MNWVQGMLDDEAVFPSKIGKSMQVWKKDNKLKRIYCYSGVPFPRTFHSTIKSIVRRLFRVYAHLYNHHFAQLCALSIEGSLRLLPLLYIVC